MSDFDWKAAIGKLAPTIAAMAGGPLLGMAVEYAGNALGLDKPTESKIEAALKSGNLNGDQLVALKNAEREAALKLEELGVRRDELGYADNKSARDMQMATQSRIPGTLAILVTVGFFSILGWMLTDSSVKPTEALLVMLGSLGTAWASIIGFYFGSSHGGRATQAALVDKLK